MEKITKRQMFEMILACAKENAMDIADYCDIEDVEVTNEDVIEFCTNEIALLDKKAAKAKERAAVKAAEGDALYALVESVLTEEFRPIAEIAADVAMQDAEATVSKVTYRLGQLVKNEVAEKKEVIIPGAEGTKARKLQAYRKLA